MALITILLGILIERFLGSLEEMRRFHWFDALLGWVRGFGWSDGAGGVVAAVFIPVLAVLLAAHLLHLLWWPLSFLFALLVLLYCLGPRDLEAEVEAFLDARERDDDESAWLHARDLLGETEVNDGRELTHALLEAILVEANERLLGILFWFVVLGPAGALMYRLSAYINRLHGSDESTFATAGRQLHYLLAWLPARLTALSYALSGSFVDAMHHWRQAAAKWQEEGRGVLIASGFGALRYCPEQDEDEEGVVDLVEENSYVHEAIALVRRAVVVWLAVLALLTLAGWAS